jgi:hypothetical protein
VRADDVEKARNAPAVASSAGAETAARKAPSVRVVVPAQSREALFHLTNRLLPIKLALRQLSRMVTVHEWPNLEDFQWEAAEWARRVCRRLRKKDVKNGATYGEKLAVGFRLVRTNTGRAGRLSRDSRSSAEADANEGPCSFWGSPALRETRWI